MDFFVFISRSETTHFASFLFPVSYSSAAQKAKISLIALTVASLDNHLVLHARCNCQPYVFIVVWCIARQADRNGFTVKRFHRCIKVLSQFRIPYCTNLQQYSKRLRWCAWLCTDTKLTILASNFCAWKLCRPITLQPSVAIAMCRKTCLSQIVLLRCKAKPYLAFLGCHFDTNKRLKTSRPVAVGIGELSPSKILIWKTINQ